MQKRLGNNEAEPMTFANESDSLFFFTHDQTNARQSRSHAAEGFNYGAAPIFTAIADISNVVNDCNPRDTFKTRRFFQLLLGHLEARREARIN